MPVDALAPRPGPPRFVGALTGRSGTTWIERVLRQSLAGQVETIGERHFFWLAPFVSAPDDWWQARADGRSGSWFRQFRGMAEGYAYRTRVEKAGAITYGGLVRLLPKRAVKMALDILDDELSAVNSLAAGHASFGNFYLRLLSSWSWAVAGRCEPWISKEPAYGHQCVRLFRLVPDARLVVLARDGQDVALSSLAAGWADTYQEAISIWRDQTRETLDGLSTLPASQWRLIRFEDLVTGFDEGMRDILEFLDLPVPQHTMGPRPDASRKAVWKTSAPPGFLAAFAAECGNIMSELGYEV